MQLQQLHNILHSCVRGHRTLCPHVAGAPKGIARRDCQQSSLPNLHLLDTLLQPSRHLLCSSKVRLQAFLMSACRLCADASTILAQGSGPPRPLQLLPAAVLVVQQHGASIKGRGPGHPLLRSTQSAASHSDPAHGATMITRQEVRARWKAWVHRRGLLHACRAGQLNMSQHPASVPEIAPSRQACKLLVLVSQVQRLPFGALDGQLSGFRS